MHPNTSSTMLLKTQHKPKDTPFMLMMLFNDATISFEATYGWSKSVTIYT